MNIRDSGHLGEEIVSGLKAKLLPRIAQWSLRSRRALPESPLPQSGYRDLYFDDSERGYHWEYPRSNSAERISAYLALHHALGDAACREAAVGYADAMLDPVYGIYRGPDADCVGQVWYWRDMGSYMTNYTMRVPPAMFELFDETGDRRYFDAALLSGEALLRCQRENGILKEYGLPANYRELNLAGFDYAAHPDYCTDYKINSRIGYATFAFAELYRRTGDDRYLLALERLAYGLRRFQNPDGSIPSDLALKGYKPITPLVKNHFQGYVLNGCAAALKLMPELKELREFTLDLAAHLVRQQRRSGGCPYGNIDNVSPEEPGIWKSATAADTAPGLKILHEVTGEPRWREQANRLLIGALLNVIQTPEQPDWDGAIPIWIPADSGNARIVPALGGYFHFFTVLGLLR